MAAQIKEAHPGGGVAAKRKPQIATALLSVVGTVLVAFIGVLPQLRNQDVATITELQQQLAQLKLQSNLGSGSKDKTPAQTPKGLRITGTITDLSGARPLSGAEVFLVPQSKPKHIGQTGADGSFRFPDLPPDRTYRIVVRDSNSGNITLGEIDEDNTEAQLKGAVTRATVRYRVEK